VTAINEEHELTLPVEMIAMHRIPITGLTALLLAIAACHGDGLTEPESGLPHNRPAAAISDAVHQGGVAQFYWLPPTVPNPGPTVTGTFDGDLLGGSGIYPQLEVRVCPANIISLCPASGAGSFQTFNGYSATPVTIHQAGNYQLLWNKNGLSSGSTHRAWVLVTPAAGASPLSLGFADVKVVESSQALKQLDPTEFVGLVAGNPLYFKFTVRTGIPGAVSVALGTTTLVPGGSTTATATVMDLHGAPIANALVSWAVTPSGSGAVLPASSVTNVDGIATTTLTAGASAGMGVVTATVGTAPAEVTGSATFTVGSVLQVLQESLVLGALHSCGVTTTGSPYCWGYGEVGQLGYGAPANQHVPVAVSLPDGVTGMASLTAGSAHTCGLTSSGVPWCWGYNVVGQLGDNSDVDRYVPVAVSLPSGVTGFTSLAAGSLHTCGLTSAGEVYCWGWNELGQLGNTSTLYSLTPLAVGLPNGVTGFVRIAAGDDHTCALTTVGAAYCWGKNWSGQLGNNSQADSFIPVAVNLPSGVTGFASITAGENHTCALTGGGTAYCWGSGAFGQLGNNQLASSLSPAAVVLPVAVTGFSSLTAGGNHTCGLSSAGAAYCWGWNNHGQLGDNSLVSTQTPVAVSVPSGVTGFAKLAAGSLHSCGISNTGAAWCWGQNNFGQVGDNTQVDRLTPQPVNGSMTFKTP
jgi:alpha-tubulin suppressor-like RCC1 family protein